MSETGLSIHICMTPHQGRPKGAMELLAQWQRLGFDMIAQTNQGRPKGAMELLAQWQRLGFDMIVWMQTPCKGKSLVY